MKSINFSFKLAIATVTFFTICQSNLYAKAQLSIQQQRSLYVKAVAAYAKKDIKLANKLTAKLKNYPLYPYLKLSQIQRDIGFIKGSEVLSFIKTYANTPLAKKAQASYLRKLARNKQWSLLSKNYRKLPLTSAYYRCLNIQAKINTGQGKKQLIEISKLWNVGNSQPKTCDPVFAYWAKKGNPTSNLAFERSWKAINKKNYKIAKFVQKKVTKKSQLNALNLFWKIKKDVSLVSNSKTLSTKTPHNNDIAAYAIRKLAIKKSDLALKTWFRDRTRFKFSSSQRKYLNVYFGNRFAKSTFYNAKALSTLQKIDPLYKYDEISEWKVRQALISQDWKKVIKLIAKMPSSLQSDNRWVYWLETAKQKANPKTYQAKYDKILKERDFYSFIAAQLSGKKLALNNQTSTINPKTTKALLQLSAVQRMYELIKHSDTAKAYQEWRLLRNTLNDKQELAMGYIVNDWGWYIQGIRIAAKLKAWNELGIRFPRSQNKLFAELSKERGIGITWPVAIARQESAYNQFAKSPAGARGFMQLMPATAKLTAKKYEVAYSGKDDLFIPRTNISLGTAYLSEMMGRFNNQAYSTAAYNAGPHRVDRWLKSRGKLPLDIWIETIPFNETRHYVQNVLTYSAIYDLLAGRKARMFSNKDKSLLAVNRR